MKTPITSFTSPCVVLDVDDVDTDQIIPARFLTTTERSGLGRLLFHDWRHRTDGTAHPACALDRPEAAGAGILVAGRNFGCGSSREHAVWALADAGFRAVISPGFADIFRANALGNGVLPIQVDAATHRRLAASDGRALTVDLDAQTLACGDELLATFAIDPFARHCLMRGIDELEFLLSAEEAIAKHEAAAAPAP